MKKSRTGATVSLAAMLMLGVPAMSAAATFIYVSDAEDATIDAYVMDTKTGALTSIGKVEAGKTVMPMAVAPNKKFLYAVVRSQPMRVLTYVIDSKTGALTQRRRRHCRTACPMFRPTAAADFCLRPTMAATRSQ